MRIVKYVLALALALALVFVGPNEKVLAAQQQDNLMCKLITSLVTSGAFQQVPGAQSGTRLAIRESSIIADIHSALLAKGFTESADGFLYSPDNMTDTVLLSLFCPPTNPPKPAGSPSPVMVIIFFSFVLLILLLIGLSRKKVAFSH